MKNLSKILNILILSAVVVIVGASFFVFEKKQNLENKNLSQAKKQDVNVDELVNKYIQQATQEAVKTRFEREKALLEAKNKLAEINKLNEIKQDEERAKIPREKQIWKESDVQIQTEAAVPTPTNRNNFYDKDPSQMTASEKKEYAKEWIANAKEAGYRLELSPDLEVIKYEPIRKPSKQSDDE